MGFGNGGPSPTLSRATLERQSPAKQRRYTFGSHDQTCHVWAQQQAETHTGQSGDGRIRFEGPTIFSYGSHFPMARFIGEYEGKRVVLVNVDSYSSSTGTHKHCVSHALSNDDLTIGVSTTFLKDVGNNNKPGADRIATAHDSLLEQISGLLPRVSAEVAEEMKAAENPDEYGYLSSSYFRDKLVETQEALAAFRAIYKPRAKVPADVVAWSTKREAEAARKAFNAKVADARRLAKKVAANGCTIRDEYKAPQADTSAYAIEDMLRRFKRDTSRLYSARNVLAKAKASRKLIAACSASIKTLGVAKTKWQSALSEAEYRDRRNTDLSSLSELREWISNNDEHHRPEALWNYETSARLWSVAIRENMPDLAEYLGRHVQVTLWNQEVPEHFRHYQSINNRVTADEWRDGKGNGYQYRFDGVEVRRKGDKLETSMGAECPFSHAVLAFKAAQRCRATGGTYQANGHSIKVGHFKVDRIETDGTLKAGCHTIAFDSMLRLAVREVPSEVVAPFPVPAVI